MSTTIHPTAFVHPTAVIGHNVTIEANVYIGPFCIIGFQPEWKGKEREDKGVRICEGARLTGLVTVDSGAEGVTQISKDCYLMKHSHVGHDAILLHEVVLSCGAKVGGHAMVCEFNIIGLNAVIHQRKFIPRSCMIGMGAVITKGLEMHPGQKYAGNPAKWIGENVKNPSATVKLSDVISDPIKRLGK